MKTPPRFLAEIASDGGTVALVRGGELHHLRDVMRLTPGDQVAVVVPAIGEFSGHIGSIDREQAMIEIEHKTADRVRTPIILAVAIIKGPRMDFLIEKAVELGVAEIRPMISARSQIDHTGAERMQRWERLAIAAAKQSLAPGVPMIRSPVTFARMLADREAGSAAIICDHGAPSIARALHGARIGKLVVACGPEGGFERSEIEAAHHTGFISAGLGSTRLRTETAALAAIAIATAALDEAEGGS
ncbi:MAG: 16S rRNA (uracil(1498)-N(3))-methyltransferase [Candidatus Binataceae bacterium]|nr:16S rRNA (uracil(1498)-N(3))-methyltransferase [Candidatus Binataceae bacterium]